MDLRFDAGESRYLRGDPQDHPVGLRLQGITVAFGDTGVLYDTSLDVPAGRFLTLLGPSGSGKTTLLRAVGGLIEPQAGSVHIGGRDVTKLAPERRGIGFVFQHYALFPHMTVYENIAFSLRVRKWPSHAIARRVSDMLGLVQLSEQSNRRPAELSGGQQQRVAMARALAFKPRVLLMDEPLGSLDKRLREALQIELRTLQRQLRITTLYVTHDQDEAFALSDEIAVMSAGKVEQVAEPRSLYQHPANRFVASFVGDLNQIAGVVARGDGGLVVETSAGLRIPTTKAQGLALGTRVHWGIRPESVQIGKVGEGQVRFRGTVTALIPGASKLRYQLQLRTGEQIIADTNAVPRNEAKLGEELVLTWNDNDVLLFLEDASSRLVDSSVEFQHLEEP